MAAGLSPHRLTRHLPTRATRVRRGHCANGKIKDRRCREGSWIPWENQKAAEGREELAPQCRARDGGSGAWQRAVRLAEPHTPGRGFSSAPPGTQATMGIASVLWGLPEGPAARRLGSPWVTGTTVATPGTSPASDPRLSVCSQSPSVIVPGSQVWKLPFRKPA